MNSKFENKTKYSKELIMQFYLYHINHSALNYFLVSLCIFLAFIQFYSYYYYLDLINLILGFVYLSAIGIIRCLNYWFIKLKSSKKIIKQDIIYNYFFYENHFVVKIINEDKYSYQEILKVKVDKDLIYIYIKKSTALIVEKYSFTKGKGIDFVKFIKESTR